jgi:hypothetical protein
MDRLEAMSTFVAVVEAGSLSAAARRLKRPLATVNPACGSSGRRAAAQRKLADEAVDRRLVATEDERCAGMRCRCNPAKGFVQRPVGQDRQDGAEDLVAHDFVVPSDGIEDAIRASVRIFRVFRMAPRNDQNARKQEEDGLCNKGMYVDGRARAPR